MERRISQYIKRDLEKKIILLSGPRQVGKTTLSKALTKNSFYLNYDYADQRIQIEQREWPKNIDLLILDEIHKMPKWKAWLKGVYDVEVLADKNYPSILVTGSSRLDIAKKMGDSLAGRHFSYRLNPLTLKELSSENIPHPLERLLKFGGFPEPFFEGDIDFYKKWQFSHFDLILRQDLISLEQVQKIDRLELLVELLRHRVGQPCSYNSLAEDLQVDLKTVKNWLTILERLFVIFTIRPYAKNIARGILKTPKHYFYDIGRVPDEGARFENLVALSLKTEIEFLQDSVGRKLSLNYIRNKEGHELDFLISEESKVLHIIEAKLKDDQLDSSFKALLVKSNIKPANTIQLVAKLIARKQTSSGIIVEPAEEWLSTMTL